MRSEELHQFVWIRLETMRLMVSFVTDLKELKNQVCPRCGKMRAVLWQTSFKRAKFIQDLWGFRINVNSVIGKNIVAAMQQYIGEDFFRTICCECALYEAEQDLACLESMLSSD
jgi:hypothetical protein